MADVTSPQLTTKGLSCHFGGLIAVNEVDFSINQGEIRALIGPNGAGKSTFVGMLCGRIPATGGKVVFQDRDVTSLPAHQRVRLGMAYTFQITSIYSRLTLTENVRLAAEWQHRKDPAAVDKAIKDALDHVWLRQRSGQLAGDLSYGHQRLLEIAMGVAQNPQLLILDEPTQGLSDAEIENFTQLLRRLARTMTILLIEHNMDVVMDTADRITVLNLGSVLATGTPSEVRGNKAVQAAYLGGDYAEN